MYALAGAIEQRYRGLVRLGTFVSLRWGELAALPRSDIDLVTCTIRVFRQLTEQLGGGSDFGPPKVLARTSSIPLSTSAASPGDSGWPRLPHRRRYSSPHLSMSSKMPLRRSWARASFTQVKIQHWCDRPVRSRPRPYGRREPASPRR